MVRRYEQMLQGGYKYFVLVKLFIQFLLQSEILYHALLCFVEQLLCNLQFKIDNCENLFIKMSTRSQE